MTDARAAAKPNAVDRNAVGDDDSEQQQQPLTIFLDLEQQQQQHPDHSKHRDKRSYSFLKLDSLYAACDEAGVAYGHVYLYRDPLALVPHFSKSHNNPRRNCKSCTVNSWRIRKEAGCWGLIKEPQLDRSTMEGTAAIIIEQDDDSEGHHNDAFQKTSMSHMVTSRSHVSFCVSAATRRDHHYINVDHKRSHVLAHGNQEDALAIHGARPQWDFGFVSSPSSSRSVIFSLIS